MLIKKGYTFDDLALIPQLSLISSRTDVDLTTRLTTKTNVKMPLIPANMDSVISDDLADVIISNGSYPIFHRFSNIDIIEKWAKKYGNNCYLSCGLDYFNICTIANIYSCRGICIDIAHGHSSAMIKTIQAIKSEFPNLEIIAGNVCTLEGYIDLVHAGADCVKVGVGCGAACITRQMTGHGTPQLTAIMECYKGYKKYNVPIIADGGIELPKHMVLALAGGGCTVMIGKLFAKTYESAAVKFINENGDTCLTYRGQASKEFQDEKRGGLKKGTVQEGVSMNIKISGSAQDLINTFCGALRSALSYSNANNIDELQKKAEFIKVSHSYLKESNFRDN